MKNTLRQDALRYPQIAHLLESLRAYAEVGRPTGDFLRCVLENDLFGALGRADDVNKWLLPFICMYIYNEMPTACWGSAEKVDRWVVQHR